MQSLANILQSGGDTDVCFDSKHPKDVPWETSLVILLARHCCDALLPQKVDRNTCPVRSQSSILCAERMGGPMVAKFVTLCDGQICQAVVYICDISPDHDAATVIPNVLLYDYQMIPPPRRLKTLLLTSVKRTQSLDSPDNMVQLHWRC